MFVVLVYEHFLILTPPNFCCDNFVNFLVLYFVHNVFHFMLLNNKVKYSNIFFFNIYMGVNPTFTIPRAYCVS